MRSCQIGFISSVILAVLLGTVGYAQVSSTFNTGLEGWLVTGDNGFAWESTTGHPGGCLSVNDLAVGDMNYIVAPAAYHGDWSGMTAADSLSAEIFFQNTSGGAVVNPEYIFRIAGPGGAAHALVGAPYYPVQNVWNLYQVALDPAQWVIESGTWPEILQAVDSLRIMGEFVTGKEVVRLDNVHLSATPTEVFIPCEYDTFNTAGTGDWSFLETGGVSNPGSGGNGGGYLSISDKSTGVSVALAPAKFLGDWSSLNNHGYVTLDVRMVSRNGTPRGTMEFIRLTGPGGSAHVNFNTADLSASDLVWKTLAYPLNAATWTVDSGTWVGLLAEVTECRIMPEFFNGTETVGLDNFGRMADSCPAIDDTVAVHDPGLTVCGQYSLVAVSSVACNPHNGGLYGLIRTTDGGLYPVTGASQGIRLQAYDKPAHLIFDHDGDGFITEDYSGNIYRYAWGGGSSLWVAGFHSGDDDPYGMCFAPLGFNGANVTEGNLLVSDYGSGGPDEIWSFSPDISEGERLVMPDPGNTDQFDLAADPDGPVYICDALDANHLYRLAPNGTLTTLTLSSPVSNIYSLVYDGVEENIYIAGKGSKAVYRVSPATGAVTLVADGFSDFNPCCLEIDPAARRLWVTDYGYNRVYEFCLAGGVSVDISLTLEGVHRPAGSGWQVPLWVGFFQPGADVLQDPALYYSYMTTMPLGGYAVAQVPGVAAGTYDLSAVSEHTLVNVKHNVVVAAPSASVYMGTLAEGNADGNDRVNLGDFSVLALAWQTHTGEANYRSQADFDRNGEVNIFDVALLCTNWLDASPLDIP